MIGLVTRGSGLHILTKIALPIHRFHQPLNHQLLHSHNLQMNHLKLPDRTIFLSKHLLLHVYLTTLTLLSRILVADSERDITQATMRKCNVAMQQRRPTSLNLMMTTYHYSAPWLQLPRKTMTSNLHSLQLPEMNHYGTKQLEARIARNGLKHVTSK